MDQRVLIGIAVVVAIVILYFGYKKYMSESFTPEQTNKANSVVMFVNSQAATKKSDYAAYARFLLNTKNTNSGLIPLETYYAIYDAAVNGTLSPTDVLMRMK
jgi:hypothetical protein